MIRNDRTGVIVEVSDRSGNNGITIWRNGKDGIATWETADAKTGAKVEEKFAGRAAKTEGVGKEGAKEVPLVKWSAQEKHFPGQNSYTPPGRSILTSDPRKLAERAGSGQQIGNILVGMPGSKERVNFGEPIGTYIDGTGLATPTTNEIIHCSKDGIHIVPARP